jgi:hypothetical protein
LDTNPKKLIESLKSILFQEKEPVSTKEVGRVIVPENRDNQRLPWNPDPIYNKRRTYEIYTEMMRDYQIRSVVDVKKNIILGAEWSIDLPVDEKGEEMEELREVQAFVSIALKEFYEGSFTNDLHKVLDAMIYGFSLSELVWELSEKGQIVLKRLKNIPPDGITLVIRILRMEPSPFQPVWAIGLESGL